MTRKFVDQLGYKIFTSIGVLIILSGVLMMIFRRKSSFDIGLKYGPPESSNITGFEVISLGVITLMVVLVFYLVKKSKSKS
jgi:Na+/H+ antiporter NhaD/arsenite permease-like protein